MRRNASSVSSTEEMRLALTAAAASSAVAKSGENWLDAALAVAVAIAAPRNSRRVGIIHVILLECGCTDAKITVEASLGRCWVWSSKPVCGTSCRRWVRLPLASANLQIPYFRVIGNSPFGFF